MTNDSDDEAEPVEYATLASGALRLCGAVHASGEAYLDIDTMYTDDEGQAPIEIDGSVHVTGYEEMNIGETHPVPESAQIEPAASGKGFSELIEEWPYSEGVVEDRPVHIGNLVLLREPEPTHIKAVAEKYDGYFDEIELHGNVHSPGTLTVRVQNAYII